MMQVVLAELRMHIAPRNKKRCVHSPIRIVRTLFLILGSSTLLRREFCSLYIRVAEGNDWTPVAVRHIPYGDSATLIVEGPRVGYPVLHSTGSVRSLRREAHV